MARRAEAFFTCPRVGVGLAVGVVDFFARVPFRTGVGDFFSCVRGFVRRGFDAVPRSPVPVSYTHLTLPTNREV